ncbi:MAG: hypothetical protein ACKVIE_02280 [Candidatus Poseidoniales archaeon]|jgi:hypothetical protein
MEGRANLSHRLGLALILFVQITIIPIIGFSLTYLIDIDRENFSIAIRTELFHWILISGLTYGIICLALALIIGGYRPTMIVERGGWLPTLGLSQRKYDPELIDRAKMAAYSSPYGKMSRLVANRIKKDQSELFAVHGGLQLLAVPSQVLLISIPLIIMEGIPEDFIRKDSALKLGMIGYIIGLWVSFRVQPIISSQLVGFAAMFRKVLWRITKISWILPVIILWGCARLILQFSLSTLGIDITQWHDVQLEGVILNLVAPEAQIPETAILDFLVAISVLPMAAFTTISVLGGSNGLSPWMRNKEDELENLTQQSLPEPTLESTSNSEDNGNELQINEESDTNIEGMNEERMIDVPFDLFD